MRVLVTGSSGFVGQYLVESLLGLNHKVVGCDLRTTSLTNNNFHSYTTDFTNKKEIQRFFSKHEPDHCLHIGAIADLNYAREHGLETVRTNIFGTGVIAEMCRRFDCFLTYISTCCVYGDTNVYPTNEDAKLRPTELYGSSKLAGEYVVKGYQQLYGLKYNILRYSTIYGPRMRKALAIYIFLSKAIKKEKLPIHGDGGHTRSYVFIKDLVDATVRAMQVENQTINIAGSKAVSTSDLARLCWQIANPNEKEELEFISDRPGNVKKEHIDITKAKMLLNWTPKTSIKEGLRVTCHWLKGALDQN
jgi:nucleoside-diphosphate-sugar epimerase